MAYDAWGGYNEGMQNLGNTFTDIETANQRRAALALQQQLGQQQLQENALKLADMQRAAAVRQSARDAYANAQDTTTTTVLPSKPSPAALQLQGVPGAKYIGKPTPLTGSLESEMAANGLADISPDASGFSLPKPEASPLVQAYNEGRVTSKTIPADRVGAAAQAYMAGGMPEEAMKIVQQGGAITDMMAKMKAKATEYGNPQAAADFDAKVEHLDKVEKLLVSLKQADPTLGLLKQTVANNPQMFSGIDASKIGMGKNGVPMWDVDQNGVQGIAYLDTDGKIKFQAANERRNQTWSKPYEKLVGGKRVLLQESSTGETKQISGDTSTTVKITGGIGGTPTGGTSGPLNAQGVNPKALDGLDPGRQALIKKIANYEVPIPNSRSKEGISLLSRVALYDPSFDAQLYPKRQLLRNSFSSGPDAKNITSLNTAVHHLDQLDNSFSALGNRSMPVWNAIANKFEAATGDPKLVRVVNDINAVKGELAATFKGTGATDQEIKAWQEGFSTSSSPAQAKASIQEGVKLLQGRLDALIDKYQSGMGKSVDIPILSPKSLHTLEKLGVNVDRYKALGSQSAATTTSSNRPLPKF